MKALRIPTPVKYILIIFAVVFAAFVYSFWGSKLESQNKDIRTPEAYGLDSLEYQAEPVIEIRVWQRNDKNFDDYPERSELDSFFYTILPLSLETGSSIDTVCYPSVGWNNAVMEILYDGNISGFYDIKGNMLDYTGETDKLPSYGISGVDVRRSTDGTFGGNQKVTLSVFNYTDTDIKMSLDPSLSAKARGQYRSHLQSLENRYAFRFEDYYHTESFHEVYPDAPVQEEAYKNLKNFQRIVMTNYLTVQAMHPTKPNTPVATAVLEITQYSSWFGKNLNDAEVDFVLGKCDRYASSGKITVVSYEQSDSFSME